MKQDIKEKTDVQLLVEKFYEKVRQDEMLAPIFSKVDWEHHTPIIINFWSMILLGDRSYTGNPFQKHLPLNLRGEHFQEWLRHFRDTVRENFSGPVADEAIARAESIAILFQHKLGLG